MNVCDSFQRPGKKLSWQSFVEMTGTLQECQRGSKELVYRVSVFVILRSLVGPTAQPF